MKVLIAGGSGFIGSHLVDYHLALNDTVFVIDDLSTGKFKNIIEHLDSSNLSFYKADILHCVDLEFILDQCDIIYNLAAVVGMFNILRNPIDTLCFNIQITEKILSTVTKLNKKPLILLASSSEVYGNQLEAMKEDEPLRITSTHNVHAGYPISKLCNEVYGVAYAKEKELPITIARIFNTIGTRQSARHGTVLPRFIQQALQGEDLTIFCDGKQTRCFCDVRDLCRILHQLVLNEQSKGQIVNVGSDQPISILDLARLVIEISQSKSSLKYQNYEDVYGKDYIEIVHRQPDLTKLKKLISYSLQWPLEKTIKEIIDYKIAHR